MVVLYCGFVGGRRLSQCEARTCMRGCPDCSGLMEGGLMAMCPKRVHGRMQDVGMK